MENKSVIGITATAKKVNRDELTAALQLLEEWDFKVVQSENLFLVDHQFAGSDTERADALQKMINDPRIEHILCARGGYGTLRIVDQIDFSALKKSGKLIAGYSDITVLHNHLLSRYNTCSLHATMPINMHSNTPASLESLKKGLQKKELRYSTTHHPLNRKGQSEGLLFGGNLSLMYALNGSASMPDPRGKILFIEDLDEYLYHIDRMMLSLKRSGVLSHLSGLLVGSFTEMKDNAIPFGKTAEEIIAEHVMEYDYPVCFGFPAGHIENNCALVMGGKLRMQVNHGAEIVSTFHQ